MKFIECIIEAIEEHQEQLIADLSDFPLTGFEQKEKELIVYFEESFFNEIELKNSIAGFTYHINIIENKNWNEEWEKNFKPVRIHDFCAIRAHFHEPITDVHHEIIITPKMSFGTGHHATTYMMIEQMKELDFSNKSVFDFGTGTGILSILAERLGAASITAIDSDEWSIANAKENADLNQSTSILFSLSSQIPEQSFDLILANINKNIILEYLPQLNVRLNTNGNLLVSGLFVTDENEIISAANHLNLSLQKRIEKENWLSLLFINAI